MQAHLRPWCDRWFIYHSTSNKTDNQKGGLLVHAVLEHGLASRLQGHMIWKGLAAGTRVSIKSWQQEA